MIAYIESFTFFDDFLKDGTQISTRNLRHYGAF